MKIEGKNAVFETLKSNTTVDTLLVEKGASHELLALARKKNVKIVYVDKRVLDKRSVSGKHQGFIAEVSEFEYSSIDDILENKKDRHFILLLDGLEDPHNLGSILRVCECAGIDGVVIAKNRSVAVNDTVVRISAGASSHVKVCRVTNINDTIKTLKQKNIWVYCSDMEGQSIYKTQLTGDIALVIGGEGNGVSKLTRELCDGVISLPLFGKVNSLNASVAAGIVIYEAVRQNER